MGSSMLMVLPPGSITGADDGTNTAITGANTIPESNKRTLISQQVLAKVQELRYMHIAVGCVSIAFGLFMIGRIWYDVWSTSQLKTRLRPRRFAFLFEINPAEIFPLILGVSILFQEVLFIAVQGTSLSSFKSHQCELSGQLVYPVMFLLGYIHLVFGLEMTIRAMRNFRGNKHQKYIIPLGLFAVILLLVLTFLSTLGSKVDSRRCVASVVWRATGLQMVEPTVSLLAVFIIGCLIMATIIALQLFRTVNVEPSQRVAASRMVYYLIATAIIYAFVAPFFIQVFTGTLGHSFTTAFIAEFAIFVSGSIFGFLYLFLRANAARTAMKPKEAPWQPRKKFRIFGPNDLEIINISAPLTTHNYSLSVDETLGDQYSNKKPSNGREFAKIAALPDFSFPPPKTLEATEPSSRWPLPEVRLPSPTGSPALTLRQTTPKSANTSYSLFPGTEDMLLPAAVYSPASGSQITPMSPLRAMSNRNLRALTAPSVTDVREAALAMGDMGRRPSGPQTGQFHRRGSSVGSCATVQIGIRLSSAPVSMGQPQAGYNSQLPPPPPPPPPKKDSVKTEEVQFLRPDVFTGPSSSSDQRKGSTGGDTIVSVDLNAFSWPDKELDPLQINKDTQESSKSKRRSLTPPSRLDTLIPPAKQIRSALDRRPSGWV